ncbi:MAG: Mur ligase family protein, partial [Verrucomicrobiae bacterium]|nr:Mur ligase family protein [Verrucomicrobiae bacterium]
MEKLSLAFIARACGAPLKGPMVEAVFNGVSSDSRRIRPGEIFIALQGDCYDGHDFLSQAAERGATAVIVSNPRKVPEAFALPVIHVPNTLTALQQLAADYRKLMPLKTIAVTGSNGKTSTKEMLAALLSERFQTIKSEGNLNNHIGVPLSLLRIRPFHEIGVFELAMNHPCELAPLARMVAPVVGIITNVGPVHLEGMGNEEGVAREKAAVIAALPPDGVAVLNADNKWTPWLRDYTRARIVTAGLAPNADVRAENIRHTDSGVLFDLLLPAMDDPWPGTASSAAARGEGSKRVTVSLRLLGDHWVSNALLAAAAARWLDRAAHGGPQPARLADLAAHLGVTDRHLRRIFKAAHG